MPPRKQKHNVDHPPPSWIHRGLHQGIERSEAEVEAMWDRLSVIERRGVWGNHRGKLKRLAVAKEKIAQGSTDGRLLTLVEQGGYIQHRMTKTWKAQGRAIRSDRLQPIQRQRLSKARLVFRLANAKGCSVEGCPLAPIEGDQQILELLEHDHIDETTKRACVSTLASSSREEELAKTRCVCLWHHWLHTREQVGDRPIAEKKQNSRLRVALLLWKEMMHCEHPCHDSMPYASLVPQAEEDPLIKGFLEVSHVLRGRLHETSVKDKDHLKDLLDGKAVIHCKFCHALWSLCEDSKLHSTPRTTHEMQVLQARHPEVVKHFEEKTAGFDWVAEKARILQQAIDGKKRKKELAAAKRSVVC